MCQRLNKATVKGTGLLSVPGSGRTVAKPYAQPVSALITGL
jgi:hypothetical protein